MREALWSAVACYRFRSGLLAGRRAVHRAWMRGRELARVSKRQQAAHSRAPAARKFRVLSLTSSCRLVLGTQPRKGNCGGAFMEAVFNL